jgi:hypothetical protein
LTRDTPRGRHPTAARSPPEGDRAVAVAARSRAEARSRVAEPAVLATPESAAGPAVSDRWTPRDPPASDGQSHSEEPHCQPTAAEATADTRFSRPRRTVRRTAARPPPRGWLCGYGRRPKASSVALRGAPKCVRSRGPAPEGTPATGQTAVSMSSRAETEPPDRNPTPLPKLRARAEARGTHAPKCVGRDLPKRVTAGAPKRTESPSWLAPKYQCREPKPATVLCPKRSEERPVLGTPTSPSVQQAARWGRPPPHRPRPMLAGVRKTEP